MWASWSSTYCRLCCSSLSSWLTYFHRVHLCCISIYFYSCSILYFEWSLGTAMSMATYRNKAMLYRMYIVRRSRKKLWQREGKKINWKVSILPVTRLLSLKWWDGNMYKEQFDQRWSCSLKLLKHHKQCPDYLFIEFGLLAMFQFFKQVHVFCNKKLHIVL